VAVDGARSGAGELAGDAGARHEAALRPAVERAIGQRDRRAGAGDARGAVTETTFVAVPTLPAASAVLTRTW
jgi:hypothetical protein